METMGLDVTAEIELKDVGAESKVLTLVSIKILM